MNMFMDSRSIKTLLLSFAVLSASIYYTSNGGFRKTFAPTSSAIQVLVNGPDGGGRLSSPAPVATRSANKSTKAKLRNVARGDVGKAKDYKSVLDLVVLSALR